MIIVTEYSGKKVAVFGLGKSGEATVAALKAGGAKIFAGDDKTGADYIQWPWTELAALVLSPGVPLTHPKPHPVVEQAHKHHVPIIGDIELLYRACPDAQYIGITGTNGKSTTTTLIGHILKEAGLRVEIGGNLGTPALALEPLGKDGIYVLELSSYQLDLVKTTRFNIAVLLNITPDHLDRHGDMDGYIKAKMHIFERQTPDDKAIIAVDDEYTKEIVPGTRYSVLGKSVQVSAQQKLESGVYAENGRLHDTCFTEYRVPSTGYDLSSIPTLTGRHNWQNAAAAYAAARACGVAPDTIYQAMQSFPGLRHRLQLVATINGVRFINDSKATNADATSNALAPYDHIYWIVGGKPKAGGIASLEMFFPKIAHAFLIGQAAEEFAKTFDRYNSSPLEGERLNASAAGAPREAWGEVSPADLPPTAQPSPQSGSVSPAPPQGGSERHRIAYTRSGTLQKAVEQAAAMAFSSSSASVARPGIHGEAGANGEMDPRIRLRRPEDDMPVVLLSPACASFDQFKSFEQRGDVFCALVSSLKDSEESSFLNPESRILFPGGSHAP